MRSTIVRTTTARTFDVLAVELTRRKDGHQALERRQRQRDGGIAASRDVLEFAQTLCEADLRIIAGPIEIREEGLPDDVAA
ncbi:hypothetical protein FHP25_32745 [Vineibacter terrae]|uniref:Uncharacterized protein n=1 Tax=Vineibacter terrae TaxID=2586908 RepID=A0A5C8PBF6_9HYPH|nr:hypothetical protein [Vineibacter terrae]TXL70888.1 hypothetical protein FHP25_32745 [Vineibacter terrae]